jgi:hypothetical protein
MTQLGIDNIKLKIGSIATNIPGIISMRPASIIIPKKPMGTIISGKAKIITPM